MYVHTEALTDVGVRQLRVPAHTAATTLSVVAAKKLLVFSKYKKELDINQGACG